MPRSRRALPQVAAVTALAVSASLGPAAVGVADTVAGPTSGTAGSGWSAASSSGQSGQQGYPRQTELTEPPIDPGDAAIRLGLTPYHDLAPRLNALQAASDRVSAEVIGQSVSGRELYLVTLTAPETPAQSRRQDRMRGRILDDSERAARDRVLAREYKAPVFLNANIHGNEWEGTDAALRLIEHYATSEDPQVEQVLASTRISLVVSMNPDGRVDNTRANASGFDLNRDLATATQPEVVAVRDAIIDTQPVLLVDLHGYVNGTLVEPTTPPHGENYEFDLFISHAYPNGLGIEQTVLDLGYTEADDGVRPPQIPFRDWEEGWDGWPPIFTPQYSAFHGAVAHTVEVPLRVNNSSYALPVEELRRRSAINTDIAHAALEATLAYAVDHRGDLVADQIEVFRRGAAGEAQRPVTEETFPEIGPEDVWTTDFPRAYVIPAGSDQRSAAAAARLVDHLVANDVEVTQARRSFTAAGSTYPAGSYVVDLHQPKRGLANALLAPGADISDRVDSMYDISGWSHGLLWGADVATVPDGADLRVASRPVDAADPTGRAPRGGDLRLELLDPADLVTVHDLVAAGADVRWGEDGSVAVPAAWQREAAAAARRHGAQFTLSPTEASGEPVTDVVVAAAAPAEEVWALREMGFTVWPVSADSLNDGARLGGADTLYVSSRLRLADLDPGARAEVEDFLAGGGGVVGQGLDGADFQGDADLLGVEAVAGRSDANGVIAVQADPGSPITAGSGTHGFVYSPVWFTDLGAEVDVDQRYADEDPLVSGHWRADSRGTGGPEDAQGRPVVVSGVDESGSPVVLVGSEPLFRAHPKGQYALIGRALLWTGLQD